MSIYSGDEEGLRAVFVGRSIRSVGGNTLTLDNGAVLEVVGNEGCGGCGNGWYSIEHLATFPNVITNVETREDDDEYGDTGTVRLFVYAEGIAKEVVTAEGYDNGYYGTGFYINVKKEN